MHDLIKKSYVNHSINIDLENDIFKNKLLFSLRNLNYAYEVRNLWSESLNFDIYGSDRISLSGRNGSGKTCLINILIGNISPSHGEIGNYCSKVGIINQKYELLKKDLNLLENIKIFANPTLSESDLRIRLSRFLFFTDDVFKIVSTLSGGEMNRLALACLLASSNSPELIILDEPTNNLDIDSVEQLTTAINEYNGAILVVSHDLDFLRSLKLNKEINL